MALLLILDLLINSLLLVLVIVAVFPISRIVDLDLVGGGRDDLLCSVLEDLLLRLL
jgi:hypothetical protein